VSDVQQAIHAVLPVEVAELVRQATDRAVELLEPASGDSAESRSPRSIGSAAFKGPSWRVTESP
jgi:hypothetical protein